MFALSALRRRRVRWPAAVAALSTVLLGVNASATATGNPTSAHQHDDDGYTQVNLVSDQAGRARVTDPHLVNPWGLSQAPTSPLWVSDNGTDLTTLYTDGDHPAAVPLVISIPGGAPTGQVFNSTSAFRLPNGAPAAFLFASEAGRITAWNPQLTPVTQAVTVASDAGAVYKGLALVRLRHGQRLLAADFRRARIAVFNGRFHPVRTGRRAFRDRLLPRGYAPFNVAVMGRRVLVSYALQAPGRRDDQAGPGHGFVDVYSAHGRLLRRLIRRGVLSSPWAMTIAPLGFGDFSGALLVGNFGNGRVHAFDPRSGRRLGVLRASNGHVLAIDGLWGLLPGNGVSAPADEVWFSAGPNGEQHGLLGVLRSDDED
jgi:uncharacterized protein (TIGR03118 family)